MPVIEQSQLSLRRQWEDTPSDGLMPCIPLHCSAGTILWQWSGVSARERTVSAVWLGPDSVAALTTAGNIYSLPGQTGSPATLFMRRLSVHSCTTHTVQSGCFHGISLLRNDALWSVLLFSSRNPSMTPLCSTLVNMQTECNHLPSG